LFLSQSEESETDSFLESQPVSDSASSSGEETSPERPTDHYIYSPMFYRWLQESQREGPYLASGEWVAAGGENESTEENESGNGGVDGYEDINSDFDGAESDAEITWIDKEDMESLSFGFERLI
jgi:hypothetical protein